MIAQMATSVAFELGLHHDVPANLARKKRIGERLYRNEPEQRSRNLEDQRTMIAVFHLSSS